jgi:hypothetical protein
MKRTVFCFVVFLAFLMADTAKLTVLAAMLTPDKNIETNSAMKPPSKSEHKIDISVSYELPYAIESNVPQKNQNRILIVIILLPLVLCGGFALVILGCFLCGENPFAVSDKIWLVIRRDGVIEDRSSFSFPYGESFEVKMNHFVAVEEIESLSWKTSNGYRGTIRSENGVFWKTSSGFLGTMRDENCVFYVPSEALEDDLYVYIDYSVFDKK